MLKKILCLFILFFTGDIVFAQDIDIQTFEELINSTPSNGDTLIFTRNLDASSSIGNYFQNLNLTFDGKSYFINGDNLFGGFVLNRNNSSQFRQLGMINCQGQLYNYSKYAGAIFNNGGDALIQGSDFSRNFVNSEGYNFGVGGALYNRNSGSIMIDNSTFSSNYAYGASSSGGAIANGYDTTADLTINNSLLENNFTYGEVISNGGALYNSGNTQINNSTLNHNYIYGSDGIFGYGGAAYNTGTLSFNNTIINDNYVEGSSNSFVFGGAVYNSNTLNITNSTLKGNHVDAMFTGAGGAIFNADGANATIKNSILEDNYISQEAQVGHGGAVYNAGTLNLEGTSFRNNTNRTGELNDIYNSSENSTINFNSSGTNNILSGIAGIGTINKNDSGILNLGGKNNNYNGDFNFNAGTLNLLAGTDYFNAANTNFSNGINFNMQNGEIDNINFGNLSLSGTGNIFADLNLNTNTMDRINASSVSGSGNLHLEKLLIEGTPKNENISIPFANSVLKDYVSYTPETIETPLYNYYSSYTSSDGNINFTRSGFNPSVYIPAVASQLAGYLVQLDTYKNIFSNLDMVMITPPDITTGYNTKNKMADASNKFAFSPVLMPEERKGIWFKPYTTFENVPLKNGPQVSNVSYGCILGGESELTKLKKNWYMLYGAYLSYNGSHQTFDGNGIYNNGGLLGVDAVFYRGNFFSAWTANAGANSAEASSKYGRDNFVMFNTGIAEKTGYNWALLHNRLILQPSLLMSYSFINTFNYTTSSDLHIDADPIHAIHIEPQIKIIGNFREYLQPYLCVSMVWNIIDKSNFQANDVYLPQLSIKPFVQYGVGVQKRWGDRLTGFLEAMIRNGGRNGIALQFGLRFSI